MGSCFDSKPLKCQRHSSDGVTSKCFQNLGRSPRPPTWPSFWLFLGTNLRTCKPRKTRARSEDKRKQLQREKTKNSKNLGAAQSLHPLLRRPVACKVEPLAGKSTSSLGRLQQIQRGKGGGHAQLDLNQRHVGRMSQTWGLPFWLAVEGIWSALLRESSRPGLLIPIKAIKLGPFCFGFHLLEPLGKKEKCPVVI